MSVNKLGVILFSSFLVLATAPVAPAQAQQDEKKQTTQKKGTAAKDSGNAASSSSQSSTQAKEKKSQQTPAEKKAAPEQKAAPAGAAADTKAGTEKKATGAKGETKSGAKKAKKTSSISKDKTREAQMALQREGFDPGPIDGIMGPMTMTALRNFQSHNKLEVTGTLNAETERALMQGATAGTNRQGTYPPRSSNEQYQQPANPQSEYQTDRTTREPVAVSPEAAATSVDDVKHIQQALSDLMYSPGDINGMMSSQTQQAIREFQFLNALPVTGVVDEQTKIALDTQWNSGVENAKLGQSPLSAEREKPSAINSESEKQNTQTRTDTTNQNRSDTYNQNRPDTYNQDKSNTYSQNRQDTYNQDKSNTYSQNRTDTYSQDRTTTTAQDRSTDNTRTTDTKHRDHAAAKTETKGDKDASKRVSEAAAVLQDLTASSDKRVPNELLERAEAIAVIPHMIKGAFVIGGRYGKGLVSERAQNGRWSAPAFIEIGGGSFGAQIGGSATDLVLVFTDRNALDLLAGGKDLKLGVDAGIVAGPLGREAEAGVNANLKSAIYAYSRSKGLFAGIALDGAVLNMDKDMNHKVYGESADAKQILDGGVAANASVRPFMDVLEKVVPKKRLTQK
jgi:lipid-binding SYLF domain-containing protein/peptidoglycan hydrolase-like protein with peptidoglycan-binding domain